MNYYKVLNGEVETLIANEVQESKANIFIDGKQLSKTRGGAFYCISQPVAQSIAIGWIDSQIEYHVKMKDIYLVQKMKLE